MKTFTQKIFFVHENVVTHFPCLVPLLLTLSVVGDKHVHSTPILNGKFLSADQQTTIRTCFVFD